MKYYVDLVRHTILDRREVEAENKKEAEEKAMNTFHKFDLDTYDEVWVEEVKEVEE
ncbi:hypothetical protein [uncultured Arcobacter sp.]|uniref:hypothetical protein n=1 Tax=uncultured Arcobacter sp. TaxID=165434 RepID=UPI002624CF8E|nr:hypothetical protein [uncultured Arcobacter sp.]